MQGPLRTQPGSPWDCPPADLFIRIPFLLNLVNAVPIPAAAYGNGAEAKELLEKTVAVMVS